MPSRVSCPQVETGATVSLICSPRLGGLFNPQTLGTGLPWEPSRECEDLCDVGSSGGESQLHLDKKALKRVLVMGTESGRHKWLGLKELVNGTGW